MTASFSDNENGITGFFGYDDIILRIYDVRLEVE
jgi:hypothetical protein